MTISRANNAKQISTGGSKMRDMAKKRAMMNRMVSNPAPREEDRPMGRATATPPQGPRGKVATPIAPAKPTKPAARARPGTSAGMAAKKEMMAKKVGNPAPKPEDRPMSRVKPQDQDGTGDFRKKDAMELKKGGMACGGKTKKYAKGGKVRGSGCATKGTNKAKVY